MKKIINYSLLYIIFASINCQEQVNARFQGQSSTSNRFSHSASNSKSTGHSASTKGQHATMYSSNTGIGTGSHTVAGNNGRFNKTFTNKDVVKEKLKPNPMKHLVSPQASKNKSSEDTEASSSKSPSIVTAGKIGFMKKESASSKSAMTEHLAFEGMAFKSAQNAEANSQGNSSSGSTTEGQAAGDNMINALANAVNTNGGGGAVTSNAATTPAPKAPPAPTPAVTA